MLYVHINSDQTCIINISNVVYIKYFSNLQKIYKNKE